MLKKLLVLALFVSFLAVGCEKLKDAANTVTGTITGINSTYAGTWNVDANKSNFNLSGSYITINEDGSMDFYYGKDKKTLKYPSTSILKAGSMYIATYNETDPNNSNVVVNKYIVNISFEETTNADSTTTTVANVSYSIESDLEGNTLKGVFNLQ